MDATELRRVLADVNHFLSDTLAGEELSVPAKEEKESLLRTISVHLANATPPPTPPPYLDMNGASRNPEAAEEYVDSDAVAPVRLGSGEESACYEEFPVSGPLLRWERRFLLGHAQRCWASLLGGRLQLFSGRGSAKPCLSLCLRGYRARPAGSQLGRNAKKKHCYFEVVCPGKKTYQFIAENPTEMEQWITAISLAGQRQQSPSPPPQDGEELYDDVNAQDTNRNEEDEIYHVISDTSCVDGVTLPPRKPVPLPKNLSSVENSVYDDVSFSSEEVTYYNIPGKNSMGNSTENNACEEEIYDDIGNIERTESHKNPPYTQNNTGSHIKQLIQKMEASFNNRKLPLMKHQYPQQVKATGDTSGELYEPVEHMDIQNPNKMPPQLPPRSRPAHLTLSHEEHYC